MSQQILASNGQTVTVTSHVNLVTEYAPVIVINLSTTDRIWLSGDSNVSAASGVPVEPSTSYSWSTAGPLYAVLDPAASGPVSIVLTGSTDDPWQPSPVAVGAAIAEQLATEGIVTKLKIDVLGAWAVPLGQTVITVSTLLGTALAQYGTLYIYGLCPIGGNPTPLSFQWFISETGDAVGKPDLLTFDPTNPPLQDMPGLLIPVLGDQLVIYNTNNILMQIRLFGYNERIAPAAIGNGYGTAGWSASGAITNTAGTDTVLSNDGGHYGQGPHFMSLFTSTTGAGAQFTVVCRVPGMSDLELTDYLICRTIGGRLRFTGMVALPASAYSIVVNNLAVNAGGNYNVFLRAVPA